MYVTEADWQISVVTTDNQGDCYRGLIKKSDLDKVTKFKNAILAGTDGDSDEQGLQQTIVGLQGACVGQNPWLRDNSVVASIIISLLYFCNKTPSAHINNSYSVASAIHTI